MKLIAAVDENWGIGRDGDLLFHCPEDLHRFQQLTSGSIVVMGRKTWDSLPVKPLPNRTNIVLSTKVEPRETDDYQWMTLENFLTKYKDAPNVFVIGGGQIYNQLLPYIKEAFITKFFADGKPDTYIKNLDVVSDWKLVSESPCYQWGEISYQFRQFSILLQK
jgi:dihydrofolate reductase